MKNFEYFRNFCIIFAVINFGKCDEIEQGRWWVPTTEEPLIDFLCPEKEVISPCICFPGSTKDGQVECNGRSVTQNTLDNLFTQLRAVNDLTPDQPLEFYSLTISDSSLVQVDLTPFLNLRLVGFLHFPVNRQLSSIVGPVKAERSIQVNQLWFDYCECLTDQGFGEALKYFEGSMTRLGFSSSSMTGGHYPIGDGSGDLEFLPGLSAFTNLESFTLKTLSTSLIAEISRGQFKRNINLRTLDLGNYQKGLTFGNDAFVFDESPNLVYTSIEISLGPGDLIQNANFDKVTRLASFWRPITLNFSGFSSFDFLSETNFGPFFSGNRNNRIILEGLTRLVCDVRMKWVKKCHINQVSCNGCQCYKDPELKSIRETVLIP